MVMTTPACRLAAQTAATDGEDALDGAGRIPLLASLRLAMRMPMLEARAEVMEILGGVARSGELPQAFPSALTDRPAQYRLYQNERFTLTVMASRQGQVGTLRGRATWSAYAVLQGELVESRFVLGGEAQAAAAALTECFMVHQGAVSMTTTDEGRAYRLANLGMRPALSLHIEPVPEALWRGQAAVSGLGQKGRRTAAAGRLKRRGAAMRPQVALEHVRLPLFCRPG
jgi:hypothetical protein